MQQHSLIWRLLEEEMLSTLLVHRLYLEYVKMTIHFSCKSSPAS